MPASPRKDWSGRGDLNSRPPAPYYWVSTYEKYTRVPASFQTSSSRTPSELHSPLLCWATRLLCGTKGEDCGFDVMKGDTYEPAKEENWL
jgi:hypothetical protein